MYTTILKRVLDIIQIKVGHLKGENKWESSRSLDSNELDIKGLKATQRNEVVVPRQNITEAYASDLGVPEAFCSLFSIKLGKCLFFMTVYLRHLSLSLHRTFQFMCLKSSSYKEGGKC